MDVILKTCKISEYHTIYRANFRKKSGYMPEVGDLIIFDFNGTGAHVGIVEKVDGNTSPGSQSNGDGVYHRTRYLADKSTMGF